MKLISVDNHTLAVRGQLLRTAQLKQEFYYEIAAPETFIARLKNSGARVDLLSFLDTFPQPHTVHSYAMEWDNFAVIPITTVEEWLKGLPRGTRRALKRSKDAGCEMRWLDFNDDLVKKIMGIFNESPVRQGRPFWHYGKSFEDVKEMLSRDIERSRFFGAFWNGELIGFVKLIFGRNFARTTLIVSKFAHRDKGTNNAMIARAVEVCVEQKIPYLVYGQIDYGKVGNKTLAEFKLNNGFRKMDLARYYVPLTFRGQLALKLGLHHGVSALLPRNVIQWGLGLRNAWYSRRLERLNLRGQRPGVAQVNDQFADRQS